MMTIGDISLKTRKMKKFTYNPSLYPPNLFETIRNIIADVVGNDYYEITPESDCVNDLGFDSLDSVELVIKIEKEFGISITDKEWYSCRKVQDVVNLVNKLLNE